ncbi:hypothetical protein DL93DRAFT_744018 [Clavulina sp. PMI_390]|nr:hypothetical protein DL93DRAFT_744018 [Clavulina sp. PMI_390]
MLHGGSACLECRKLKARCDSFLPLCSRCHRLGKECRYPPGGPRPISTAKALEARVLELEMVIQKLTLPSTHNLNLTSKRLLEKIGRLGDLPQPMQLLGVADSTMPPTILDEDNETEWQVGRDMGEEITTRSLAIIQKAVEEGLCSYKPTELEELEELPISLSIQLIHLFLPSRSIYYFLADVSQFTPRISLPSSHPKSVHPCLLNACYLAACTSNGGRLGSFKPYFLQRTRRFLQHSLMLADRIGDFLWASVIMTVFFARERRLMESIATADATTRFAIACGLNLPGNTGGGETSAADNGLLPPPKNTVEADDRVRLAHAIYIGVQTFPQLCGCPPLFTYDDWWSSISRETLIRFQDGKVSVTAKESWRLELYLRILVTNTFERVKKFAKSVAVDGHRGQEAEYLSIETQIRVQHEALLPLYDPHRPPTPGASNPFNLRVVLGHVILYGSGLVLHSLWAAQESESRTKMFSCLQGIVDICAHSRKQKRPHLGLVNIVHMMNAIRLLARELQRSGTRGNAKLSVSYCLSIESLLEFLDNTIVFFPAWADVLVTLKAPLLTAANSISV